MKIHFNRKIALYYVGESNDEDKIKKLEDVMLEQRIELRVVQEGSLALSVEELCGFAVTGTPSMIFAGEEPAEDCLVFTGLTESQLNKALANVKEQDLNVAFKAVMTNQNRGWSFGALIYEMRREKERLAAEKENEN